MHELRVKEVSLLVTAYANKPVFVGVDRTPLKFAAVMLRHVFSSVSVSSAHHLGLVLLLGRGTVTLVPSGWLFCRPSD